MEDKTNQPEKIPAPKVRKITPLDLLKRDVKLYRADCMMSVGNDKKCRPCTAAFFESILGMIDRIALQEAIARQERKTGEWNRITKRPMTEEEVESYCELCDYAADEFEHVIYENLPHAGDNVLICTRYGTIHDDTFSENHYGCYFEEYGDLEDVVAWMPLPDPYKEVTDGSGD